MTRPSFSTYRGITERSGVGPSGLVGIGAGSTSSMSWVLGCSVVVGTDAGTVVVVLVTMGGAMVVDVVVVDVDDPGIVVVVVVVDVVVVVGEPG